MSQFHRLHVQGHHPHCFPVEYSNLLSTRSTNEDDKFNDGNSSESLLLRNDAVYGSNYHLLHKRLHTNASRLGRRKHRRAPKQCEYFNCLCLWLIVCLVFIGVLFYLFMWMVKINSKCDPSLDDLASTNSTRKFYRKAISRLLMSSFDKERIKANLRWLSKSVHVAGTPEQLLLMSQIEQEYRKLGFSVKSYEYNVLLSYPDYSRPNTIHVWADNQWTLLSDGKGLPLPSDEESKDEKRFVWWNAYSANGTVYAPIVYANYGSEEDFLTLKKSNVQIKGRIVLIRYGSVFRGDKVALAQQHGALGVILYSDPFEFAPEAQLENATFPHSVWLPDTETQRGTLLQTNGDPETLLFPSKSYVHRNVPLKKLYESQTLPSIPVTPISYRDARQIFKQLDGDEVPWPYWKGGLPVTYRLDGTLNFRLEVRNRLERRRIRNIVSTWNGEEEKFVLLSNHVDAWTLGAIDPNSGTAIMLETARVLAQVSRETGWRPRRSIAFYHSDAEEFGLIGSTEFAEEMLKPLEYRVVALINVDNVNGNSTVVAKAVPLLYKTLTRAASLVNQPNAYERESGRLTLLDSWQFYGEKGPLVGDKSVPAIRLPLFGSDFQPFLSYIGIPVADIRLESAPVYNYAIYHSAHETAWAVENFIDRTGEVFVAMGQFWLEVVRDLADSPIIPFNISDYGVMLGEFVRRLIIQLRHLGVDEALGAHWYKSQVGQLQSTVALFQKLAAHLHQHIQALKQNKYSGDAKSKLLNAINERLFLIERSFIIDQGLWENAPMKRHVVFSPAKNKEVFSNSAFALILDPALRWSRAEEESRRECLEEIRMAFTKLHYCIESAIHLLHMDHLIDIKRVPK